jgi:lambda repressor-like predicted transcriptional regulator
MAGSIRHLGDDRWQLRVYAGTDPATGRKRYTGRVHRGTACSAQLALQTVVTEVRPDLATTDTDVDDRPRWAVAELAAATGLPLRRLAVLAGYTERTGCRWRPDVLLTDERADRAACALGMHPAEVWPAWFDDVTIDA